MAYLLGCVIGSVHVLFPMLTLTTRFAGFVKGFLVFGLHLQLMHNKILFRVPTLLVLLFPKTYQLASLINGVSLNSHRSRLKIGLSNWTLSLLIKSMKVCCHSSNIIIFFLLRWSNLSFIIFIRLRIFIDFLTEFRSFHDSKYVLFLAISLILNHNFKGILKSFDRWQSRNVILRARHTFVFMFKFGNTF